MHVSNLYRIPQAERLAQRLVDATFADSVFFCNSGAEANEGMVKMIRRAAYETGQPERYRVITFEGAFHGRTLAMLAATGNEKYLKGFGPVVDGFDQVPFNNLNAVRDAIGPHTAGHHRRAGAGRGRHPPRQPGFSARPARRLRRVRPGARAGRGAVRHGAHRQAVRLRMGRHHAGRGEHGQGARRRLPDRRHPGPRACGEIPGAGHATAPPSAATRWPAPPPTRCSTSCSRPVFSTRWRARARCSGRRWPGWWRISPPCSQAPRGIGLIQGLQCVRAGRRGAGRLHRRRAAERDRGRERGASGAAAGDHRCRYRRGDGEDAPRRGTLPGRRAARKRHNEPAAAAAHGGVRRQRRGARRFAPPLPRPARPRYRRRCGRCWKWRPGSRRRGGVTSRPLAGRTLAMIFEKPSTRTRVSFEVAMRQLGGDVIMLTGKEMQLGRGETIADTARVLSRYVDAIMMRTDAHEKLQEMADACHRAGDQRPDRGFAPLPADGRRADLRGASRPDRRPGGGLVRRRQQRGAQLDRGGGAVRLHPAAGDPGQSAPAGGTARLGAGAGGEGGTHRRSGRWRWRARAAWSPTPG